VEISRRQTKIELWHFTQQFSLIGILNETWCKLLRSSEGNYLLNRIFIWLTQCHTASFVLNFDLCIGDDSEALDRLVHDVLLLLLFTLGEGLQIYIAVAPALVCS
jgi:hypothetical protein